MNAVVVQCLILSPTKYSLQFFVSLSEFIQMALNFEDSRRKWLRLERELNACKEVLTKAETERGALEVKLKHARNQVDVEIRRRQKAEADCAKLVCRLLFAWLLVG